MRKLLLIVCLLMTAGMCRAQFVSKGTVWQNDMQDMTEFLSIKGDTVVGGNVYHKVYSRYFNHEGAYDKFQFYPSADRLFSLIREDNGKIYFIGNHGDTEGLLLYDFNLEIGDEAVVYSFENLNNDLIPFRHIVKVVSEDYFDMCGIKHTGKWVKVYDGMNYTSITDKGYMREEFWIDGIGKAFSGTFSRGPLYGSGNPCVTIYNANGSMVFYDGAVPDRFSSGNSGVPDIPVDDNKKGVTYGMDGVRSNGADKGLYIRDGKVMMHTDR